MFAPDKWLAGKIVSKMTSCGTLNTTILIHITTEDVMENAFCGWLGRWYVCWLHSGSNCLLMHTVDGCIMCCNVMSVAHANRLPLLRLWSTADCDSDSFKQSCSIYLTFITPLAPLGHWDVMLVWRKGMLTELSLFYGIVCHYNGEVHNETGSSCRSVDQMQREFKHDSSAEMSWL